MISGEFVFAHSQILIQRLRIKIISECEILSVSLELVLILSQKKNNLAQSRHNFSGLVFITVAHLTIIIITVIRQMKVESNGNMEKQSYNIHSLIYQVGLLRERNRVISLENQNLIIKIEQLQKQIQENTRTQGELLKKQQIQIQNKIKEQKQLISIASYLQKNFSSKSAYILEEMIKNSCPTYSILQNLTEVIEESIQKRESVRKSDLGRLQKMVLKRKENLSQKQTQSRDVLHIVKEPTWKQNFMSESDLQYVVRSCQKLVRRVKKENIDWQKVSGVFKQIVYFINLRKSMREEDRRLRIQQRQIELGVGCRLSLETSASRMAQLEKQELNKKKEIEDRIFEF